ncbi:MAG: hypothetical protein ACOYMB_03885 [Patescibacteria group bacterium]
MKIFKKVFQIADLIEDKTRQFLSHHPYLYAFLGGAGVVIFWRGVWVSADSLMALLTGVVYLAPWWDGPLTICFSLLILLPMGIFVSSFIGNEVIISGLRGEKKVFEKTEGEIESELTIGARTYSSISEVVNRLKNVEKKLEKK